LNKGIAIIWGAVTLLPFIYFVYFINFMIGFSHSQNPAEAQAQFAAIFRLHLTTMLLIIGLIASYIVYLFKTDFVPKDKKALWAVVIFLGNLLAMPIFWFLYVWRPLANRDKYRSIN
jgi:hypothetical protein